MGAKAMKRPFICRLRRSQRGVIAAEFIIIFPILFIGIMYGIDLFAAMQFTWMMQDKASGMARQLALGQSLGATDNDSVVAAAADENCSPTLTTDTAVAPQLIQLILTCNYPGIMFTGRQIVVSAAWPAIEHIVTPQEFAAGMAEGAEGEGSDPNNSGSPSR